MRPPSFSLADAFFCEKLKDAILDARDESLIPRDPTRKAIIKGKQPRTKEIKYLNQFELYAMPGELELGAESLGSQAGGLSLKTSKGGCG